MLAAASGASAFENTIQVKVNPERQWQCGDNFFPTGGSESYRMVRILAEGQLLGTYDMANPADCDKVLEYVADLPDGGKAVTTIEVGGGAMDAPVTGRDRNRIWTVGFFVDSVDTQLTADYVEPRIAPAPITPTIPLEGTYRNTIQVKVNPERQWQCGDNFFPTGGSESYRMVRILAEGQLLGTYDMANPADCDKVLEYVVDLPDGGKAVTTVEVGGYGMDAPVTGRDRNRIWTVGFFVDSVNAELTADYVDGE
jgi:hypothetical protein